MIPPMDDSELALYYDAADDQKYSDDIEVYACPECQSTDWEVAYEDGCGDFGDDVCAVYSCNECGESWNPYDANG